MQKANAPASMSVATRFAIRKFQGRRGQPVGGVELLYPFETVMQSFTP
jgi:hypothetical protein